MKRVFVQVFYVGAYWGVALASTTANMGAHEVLSCKDSKALAYLQIVNRSPRKDEAHTEKNLTLKRHTMRNRELLSKVNVLNGNRGRANLGEMADLAKSILEFATYDISARPEMSYDRKNLCTCFIELLNGKYPELERAFLDGMTATGDLELVDIAEGRRRLNLARMLPMDIELETVNAGSIRVGQKNGKVALIVVWSMHCSSCIEALPEIGRIWRAYKASGLQMISVCLVERGDDPVKVYRLMAKIGADLPLAIQLRHESPLKKQFSSLVFPTYMLIDREGRLITTLNDKAELKDQIEKVLGLPGNHAALSVSAKR